MKKKLLLAIILGVVASFSVAFAVGCNNHQHAYTKAVAEEKYLKSEATCTDKAVYYYSCSCGEKSEKTFEYGNANGHYYENRMCTNCNALQPTDGLKYWLSPTGKEVAVSIGTATDTEIVIPSTYGKDNLPVTAIMESAFAFCSSITSVTIPDSVTAIGQWAFSYCSGLTDIFIPDSVTYIGFGAFDYCSGLTTAIIGSGVTNFGYNIFLNCRNLSSVVIRDGLTSIGDAMFYFCSELISIAIPKSVTRIGSTAFVGCDKLTVYYAGSEQDWNEIKIGDYNDELLNAPRYYNIVMDESSSESGHAHRYTEKIIKSATCTGQGSVLYICNCGDVQTINVKALGHDYQYHSAKDATCIVDGWEAYQTCSRCEYTTFKAIPAPQEHNYINGYCERCSEPEATPNALTFTLKNDGTYEVKAMYKTIQEVNIPSVFNGKLVTSIGDNAFNGCSLLESINIPESIISIGKSAFSSCNRLTSITIPNNVTSIDERAFTGCTGLTSIAIPNGVTSISYSAFEGCTNLTSIAIPNSVTSIGSYAFSYCSSLTSLNIPNAVTRLGAYTFGGCSSLKSITLPDGVTSIELGEFIGCRSLVSVTIGKNVTRIGESAFADCSDLISIIIPDSVTEMRSSAFDGCSILTIYCETIAEPVSWSSSWNYSNCPVVWDCKNNDIADDGNIYLFVNGIRYSLKDGVVAVIRQPLNLDGDYTIEETITHNNVDYAVTVISRNAFRDCINLRSITICKNITFIGLDAFDGCSGLEIAYYKGSLEDWRDIRNEAMYSSGISETRQLYLYSETAPTADGNYWHYGEDGVTPEIWITNEEYL